MKNLPNLTEEQKAETLENTVKDAVMFKQLFIIMDAVQKVLAPNEDTMYYAADYSGIYNAYNLLGYPPPKTIDEEEITLPVWEDLEDIFDKTIKMNSNRKLKYRKDARSLAKIIIDKWNCYLSRR